jgi:hypothetical protein
LRGVLRFLAPIALRGLGSFAGRTLLGTQAGKTLGEAAKAALGPSLGVMAEHAVPAASRFMNTYTAGVGPQQPQPQAQQQATQRGGSGQSLFDGIEGIPTSPMAIKKYKRAATPAPKDKCKPVAPVRFNF